MPEKITATYNIVTPMFIGDANQKASGISPSSVKGALRFWWRALNWGKFRKEKTVEEALRSLHKEEGKLFGQTAEMVNKKQVGGQGKFLLTIKQDKKNKLVEKDAASLDEHATYKLKKNDWHTYLLGLGLAQYKKEVKKSLYNKERSAIVSGNFTIELYCKNSETAKSLKPVLLLWGLIGGLGSRNRKGLGAINISSLEGETLPTNRAKYIDKLNYLLKDLNDEFPPFTAFSEKSQLLISDTKQKTPWECLSEIAKTMQMYRGWGFSFDGSPHKINGEKAIHDSHSFKNNDHTLIYDLAKATSSSIPTNHPESLLFGLPRTYGLSKLKPRREIKIEPLGKSDGKADKNKRSRRASPLFIHVHKFSKNESIIVQMFLPTESFLPKNDVLHVSQKIGRESYKQVAEIPWSQKNDWQVIDEYLALSDFKGWKVKL